MGIQTEAGFKEWRHIHDPMFNTGSTVFFEVDLKGREVRAAWATCSDKDQFNRKIGRAISKGRLEKGEFLSYPYVSGTPLIKGLVDTLIGGTGFYNGKPDTHDQFNRNAKKLVENVEYVNHIAAVISGETSEDGN